MAIPKHRGRKSKKELELLSAIEERKRMDEIAAQGTESEESSIPDVQKTQPEVLNADNINDTDIPEASLGNDEKIADEDSVDDDMLAQLQAKIKSHNETVDSNAANVDCVWAGDPGDGTDFITVVDLKIRVQFLHTTCLTIQLLIYRTMRCIMCNLSHSPRSLCTTSPTSLRPTECLR